MFGVVEVCGEHLPVLRCGSWNGELMMNGYFCDVGEREVFVEYIADTPRYEIERVCEVVIAETRGQAKCLFTKHRKADYVEFVEVRTHKLAGGLKGPARVIGNDDPARNLWTLVGELEETKGDG